MNLIKKAKIEHKVRYVEYHQGCTQPSTFGWEIRTFQGTAIQEVKNVINKIKERLIANGVTKIIIGNQKDSTDAGMYLEFNEENEPEEPWRIPSNFGDFDSRSPAETAGFINFYSAAFLENQEKIALN